MDSRLNPLQKKLAKRKAQKKVSTDELRAACSNGRSLQELADLLGVSRLSAAVYLERLLRKGEPVDITPFVPLGKQHDIEEVFQTLTTASIPRIVEQMHGRAAEEEIRIVRGYLQGKMRDRFYE